MQTSNRDGPRQTPRAGRARPRLAVVALLAAAAAAAGLASLAVGERAHAAGQYWWCWDAECNPPPPPPPPPPAPPAPPAPPPPSGSCVDEFDPYHGITYRCNPSRTTFMTPDGLDPARIGVSAESGWTPAVDCCDGGIPPAAPYRSDRDYSSDPDYVKYGSFVLNPAIWWAWGEVERKLNGVAYQHDSCYGSQLGQLFCDARWHKDGMSACKSYSWGNPLRYACFGFVRGGYQGMRWVGGGSYKPRTSHLEPAGVPW